MPAASDWTVPPAAQPKPKDYDLRSRSGARLRGRHQVDRSRRCLHRRDARHRARRQWRLDPRGRRRAHHRLPDHRGRADLAHLQRRPRRARAMRSATTRRPGSAWCRRWRGSICRRCPLGQSSAAAVGERVVVGGAGGRHHSVAAHIAARQEFAGYWEYVLDEAIFTAPAHPNWGGTALIGPHGDLLGIGSLQLEQPREKGNRASQHDRADRSPEADPRRPAHARPPQPSAAAMARALRHRGRRPDRGGRPRRAAGRRARPTCAPATWCLRSAAPK